MVKDEQDIIAHTITHLVGQGVTGIVVADNLSTDDTFTILNDLDVDCELIVKTDPEPGYYQSRKMTELAHFAFRLGADWVIPFDADELWYATDGPLANAFDDIDADCAWASLHNYFPTSSDDPAEANPFRRITHRDPQPAALPKVAVRRRADITIAQGNHNVTADRLDVTGALVSVESTLEVAHFPWRSFEQYKRKIRNGATAYRKTDLPEDYGAHWRQHGTLLEREGTDALRVVFDTYFHDPALTLEHHPAPWSGSVPTPKP